MHRRALVLVLLFLARPADAAAPESLAVFDPDRGRFSLFDDLGDASPDQTLDLVRDRASRVLSVAGDWDGDGLTDLGYYDPRRHTFALLLDRKDGKPDVLVPFRTWRSWLRPVVGDWDGDGKDDLGLYDRYARRVSLLGPARDGRVARVVQLSDRHSCTLRPFAGDFDGDGKDEIGLYDGHERTIFLPGNKATGNRPIALRSSESAPMLRPVAVDLNGDGRDELALYDAASHRFALLADLADGVTDGVFDASGVEGSPLQPLAGRWQARPTGGGGDDVPDTAYCRPAGNVPPAVAAFELAVLAEVNARRAVGAVCGQEGRFPPSAPLAMEPSLRCSARLHAQDMASRSVVSETGADGSEPGARIAAAGYAALFAGEAVAGAVPDPAAVVNAWMADGLRCSILLEPLFLHAGAGFVERPGAQRFFWVLDVGAPSM